MPDDPAVAGHDGMSLAMNVHPVMTDVHVRPEEAGRSAAPLALRLAELPDSRHLGLGTYGVFRGSTRRRGTRRDERSRRASPRRTTTQTETVL